MARLAGIIFILIGIFSCAKERHLNHIREVVDEVKQEFAPDVRTAILNAEVTFADGYTISGETNLVQAKSTLLDRLDKRGIKIKDHLVVLPDTTVGAHKFGVVNVSVANLRAEPRHSAELVTQALLGMPLNILKKQGGWLLVQSPDKYIAWTNSESVQLMNQSEFRDWKASKKVIYLETYGFALDHQGKRISDLVAGSVLTYRDSADNFWQIEYPDGRTGRIKSEEAADLQSWTEGLLVSDSSIIEASRELMGVPYLWGGTSTKGVDCSGFTRTVYFLHGLLLPRDASQQVSSGILVDSLRDFSHLQVGDLLFFGRITEDHTEKVVHVGLWLGDNQFIHASGDVHISSMDSLDENFDSYNYNRYLRTKRIVGVQDQSIQALEDLF